MKRSAAFTVIELVLSMVATSVLIGGLASCLYLSVRVFDAQLDTVDTTLAAEIQADIMRDLDRATTFSTRTPDSVTFNVPDETGDGVEETITYTFDPNVGTLLLTFNGTTTTILSGLSASQFSFLGRTMTGSAPVPTPYDVNDWGTRWNTVPTGVVYEGYEEEFESSAVTSITINLPAGTAEGDLLVAAVAYDGPETFSSISGWNELHTREDPDERVSFGVWWRIATASEPASHTFSWGQTDRAYGWIMRFTGHDPTDPIPDSDSRRGESTSPTSSGVTTTVDNCLILRLGGFDRNRITAGDTGIAGYTTITMEESGGGSSSSSGGAAYAMLDAAGSTGNENFALTGEEEYVTVTLAIQPEQP